MIIINSHIWPDSYLILINIIHTFWDRAILFREFLPSLIIGKSGSPSLSWEITISNFLWNYIVNFFSVAFRNSSTMIPWVNSLSPFDVMDINISRTVVSWQVKTIDNKLFFSNLRNPKLEINFIICVSSKL